MRTTTELGNCCNHSVLIWWKTYSYAPSLVQQWLFRFWCIMFYVWFHSGEKKERKKEEKEKLSNPNKHQFISGFCLVSMLPALKNAPLEQPHLIQFSYILFHSTKSQKTNLCRVSLLWCSWPLCVRENVCSVVLSWWHPHCGNADKQSQTCTTDRYAWVWISNFTVWQWLPVIFLYLDWWTWCVCPSDCHLYLDQRLSGVPRYDIRAYLHFIHIKFRHNRQNPGTDSF